MKLSDYKGEKAMEKLADILEPVCTILADKEIRDMIEKAGENKTPKVKIVQVAMKSHAKEILEIFAILDDVPVEEYQPSLLEIPARILEILNDEVFTNLFTSQSQKEENANSGSATVSTEAEKN